MFVVVAEMLEEEVLDEEEVSTVVRVATKLLAPTLSPSPRLVRMAARSTRLN